MRCTIRPGVLRVLVPKDRPGVPATQAVPGMAQPLAAGLVPLSFKRLSFKRLRLNRLSYKRRGSWAGLSVQRLSDVSNEPDRLARHPGDGLVVTIIAEHDQPLALRRGGDEQVNRAR